MENIVFCIPTIIRYDLCLKLIESVELSTIKPTKYHIIDNGNEFSNHIDINAYSIPIDLYSPGHNLGVSSSWNYFMDNNDALLIISNDDMTVAPNTIEIMVNAYEKNNQDSVLFCVDNENAFSFFMIHSSIRNTIGHFDEKFWPAYFEDCDYMRRILLSNKNAYHVSNLGITHYGSATLEEQRRQKKAGDHDTNFIKNREYYISKWGGLPIEEKYMTPFDK